MELDIGSSPFDADESQWLTAYADLISAVLAVVVLMLTFAELDMESLADAVMDRPDVEMVTLDELLAKLQAAVEADNLQEHVELRRDSKGLDISLDAVTLFPTNSSNIDPKMASQFIPLLQMVARESRLRNIDVEGHTDDTGKSDGNWVLSGSRAFAMRRYLRLLGFEDDGLRLIALADTEPMIDPVGLQGSQLADARRNNRRIVLRVYGRK